MKVALVDPCGPPDATALAANLADLAGWEFEVARLDYPAAAGNRLRHAGVAARAALLNDALLRYDIILCTRGGYGMSDLLERLDWSELPAQAPRLVVGFSDVSALQCALYARLGWCSLHAPMPGSSLWRHGGDDVRRLVEILRDWPGECTGRIPVTSGDRHARISGRLFGGCFSVLASLIGTDYFPRSLDGHIVFLEDVNESVPRLLRGLNQWSQAGALEGVRALVLGRFTHLDEKEQALLDELQEMIRERVGCPVFGSDAFGHVAPNLPLMIGADAVIRNGRLDWDCSPGPMLA